MIYLSIYFLFIIIMGLYIKNIVLFFLSNLILLFLLKKFFILELKYIFILLLLSILLFSKICYKEESFKNLFNEVDECNIVGQIISPRQEKDYTNKYIIKIFELNGQRKYSKANLLLYSSKDYEYGDIIKIRGEFELADGIRNEKGFNYRQYLKQLNCYGIVYSKSEEKISKKVSLLMIINSLNSKLSHKLYDLFDEEKAEILNAMLLGNKEELSDESNIIFKQSSLSHILAISGLHINYIAETLRILLDKLINSKAKKNIIVLLFLILFCVFTGASPSCLRACFMIFFSIIAEMLYRKNSKLNSIIISFILILIINPYYLENIGLWLSFGGIIGINLFKDFLKVEPIGKISKYLIDNINLSLKVQIIIFPIILFSFNTISFSFLISNLFVSFLILPIIILGYCSLVIGFFNTSIIKYIIGFIEDKMLFLFISVAKLISKISFLNHIFITPSIFSLIIYYLIISLIVLKKLQFKNKIHQLIIIILIFVAIISNLNIRFNSNLEIHFLDVGQGDSTFIITPKNKKVLIDGGEGGKESSYDYGKNVIVPYLLDKKIRTIDYIIVSHFDSDHVRWIALCYGKFEY